MFRLFDSGMDFDAVSESLEDFGYKCDSDEYFISKLGQLATQFNLNDDDLVDELIAFANNQKRKCVDLTLLDAMEPELAKKLKKNIETRSAQKPKRPLVERMPVNYDMNRSNIEGDGSFLDEDVKNIGPISGVYASFAPVRVTPSHSKYLARTIRGTIASTYNGSMYVAGPTDTVGKANIEILSPDASALYGVDKPSNVIEAKGSRLDEFGNSFREANPDVSNWYNVKEASSDEITIFGEVVLDGSEDQPLSDTTSQLMLNDENGSLVRLDLSQLASISIFPGQIVAFQGVNEAGDCFVATKQLFTKAVTPEVVVKTNLDNLHVWSAAGPFCSTESCGYEPLCDLLEIVRKEKPHLLILMGPFVDRKNKFMSEPQFDATQREVMDSLMIKIASALDGCPTEVVLQLSPTKDAASFGVFPTCPISLPNEASKLFGKKVHLVSDPAVLNVSGVQIALTGNEVVTHLSRTEFHRSDDQENTDRIGRLAGHLLSQRSLYPMSPATLPCQLGDCLRLCSLAKSPHLILLPSVLPPSVKLSSGTVLCNPGMLLRGSQGTYMRADVNLAIARGHPDLAECALWQIAHI